MIDMKLLNAMIAKLGCLRTKLSGIGSCHVVNLLLNMFRVFLSLRLEIKGRGNSSSYVMKRFQTY
jgi:hypothetical protein